MQSVSLAVFLTVKSTKSIWTNTKHTYTKINTNFGVFLQLTLVKKKKLKMHTDNKAVFFVTCVIYLLLFIHRVAQK